MLTLIEEQTESSTAELNWLPPLHSNGAIHYEIEYGPAMPPGDPVNAGSSSSPYFTLTLPNEFLTYTVKVAAVNSQGRANSSKLLLCLGQNRERGTLATQQQLLSCALMCQLPVCGTAYALYISQLLLTLLQDLSLQLVYLLIH